MRVSSLWIHPVKSCRAIAVDRAELDETGFRHDRRWMIVDPAGRFITQRERPDLATVSVTVWGDHVALTCDGHAALTLPFDPGAHAPVRTVTVWDDTVEARGASPDAARWLLTTLGIDGDVVWLPPPSARPVDPRFARSVDRVGFADGFPLLLASEGSLEAVNARLAEHVPMERFRPNVVVADAPAFEEDGWSVFRMGIVRCRAVKPCARCVIVNTDPWTGARGIEPLKTLARFRTGTADKARVYFGQNVVHSRDAIGQTVAVGDEVVVESWREADDALVLDPERATPASVFPKPDGPE